MHNGAMHILQKNEPENCTTILPHMYNDIYTRGR